MRFWEFGKDKDMKWVISVSQKEAIISTDPDAERRILGHSKEVYYLTDTYRMGEAWSKHLGAALVFDTKKEAKEFFYTIDKPIRHELKAKITPVSKKDLFKARLN